MGGKCGKSFEAHNHSDVIGTNAKYSSIHARNIGQSDSYAHLQPIAHIIDNPSKALSTWGQILRLIILPNHQALTARTKVPCPIVKISLSDLLGNPPPAPSETGALPEIFHGPHICGALVN